MAALEREGSRSPPLPTGRTTVRRSVDSPPVPIGGTPVMSTRPRSNRRSLSLSGRRLLVTSSSWTTATEALEFLKAGLKAALERGDSFIANELTNDIDALDAKFGEYLFPPLTVSKTPVTHQMP